MAWQKAWVCALGSSHTKRKMMEAEQSWTMRSWEGFWRPTYAEIKHVDVWVGKDEHSAPTPLTLVEAVWRRGLSRCGGTRPSVRICREVISGLNPLSEGNTVPQAHGLWGQSYIRSQIFSIAAENPHICQLKTPTRVGEWDQLPLQHSTSWESATAPEQAMYILLGAETKAQSSNAQPSEDLHLLHLLFFLIKLNI